MAVNRLEYKVTAYTPLGERVGTLPEITELTWTGKRNSIPVLSMFIPAATESAERVLNGGLELQLEINTGSGWREPANARFLVDSVERDAVRTGEVIKVSAIGLGGRMMRAATVWDATPGDEAGKRVFPASSPGKIINDLFTAAAKRTDQTGLYWGNQRLAWDLTPEKDTSGNPWGKNANPTFATSDSLEKVVNWLADKGAIDWQWHAHTFQAYRQGTVLARDMSKRVRFPLGTSTGQPTQTSYSDLATIARFRGDQNKTWERANTSAYRGYGRIEAWSEQGQVSLKPTADLYLEETLKRGEAPRRQWRREWEQLTSEQPCPWVDYQLGDWVRVGTEPEPQQIVEFSVTFHANGTISGWETFGTRLETLLERLARHTTDLESGAVGSDSGKPLPDGLDTRKPAKPTGVTATADTIPLDGGYRGIVTASWTPVTKASNGTALTPARYRFYLRRERSKNLTLSGSTAGNTASVSFYADPGVAYELRISAVSETGRESDLSDPIRVDVPLDGVAPPVPSLPVLSEALQVITIRWDGLTRDGQHMPPDFDCIEVHVTGDIAVSPTVTSEVRASNRALFLYAASTPGDYWVRLRARDRAGNVSGWTDPVKITVASLVDTPSIKKRLDLAEQMIVGEQAARQQGQLELTQQLQAQAEEIAKSSDRVNAAFSHFIDAYSEAAVNLIEISPYPPDAGTPDKSLWVAPDGRVFRRRLCSDVR